VILRGGRHKVFIPYFHKYGNKAVATSAPSV
jgi:hypothetical protein